MRESRGVGGGGRGRRWPAGHQPPALPQHRGLRRAERERQDSSGMWGNMGGRAGRTQGDQQNFCLLCNLLIIDQCPSGGLRGCARCKREPGPSHKLADKTRWMEWPHRNQSRLLMRAAGMFRAGGALPMYAVLGIQRETRTRKTEPHPLSDLEGRERCEPISGT